MFPVNIFRCVSQDRDATVQTHAQERPRAKRRERGERDETKNKGGLDSELATETVNVAEAVLIRAEVGCEERL